MDFVSNIKNNERIRESLIGLKSSDVENNIVKDLELKDKLIELLGNEDPKVRKNCAVLLGYYPETFDVLYNAYRIEKT